MWVVDVQQREERGRGEGSGSAGGGQRDGWGRSKRGRAAEAVGCSGAGGRRGKKLWPPPQPLHVPLRDATLLIGSLKDGAYVGRTYVCG
eukprot:6206843-Pleurochrysis_carterae.AAC.1